jgi:copper chaperone
MPETIEYTVPGMSCSHCEDAVAVELCEVAGVAAVRVDLEAKLVTVTGEGLSDVALRAAIADAGYEAA